MEADPISKTQVQETTPISLAEQRQMATPGDADQWFDSDSSSGISIPDEQDEQYQKANSSTDITAKKKNEDNEGLLQKLGIAQELSQIIQKKEEGKKQSQPREPEIILETFTHNIDKKFAILLGKLIKTRQVQLSKIGDLKGQRYAELDIRNSKVFVRAPTKQEGHAAIQKISDFIDDLNLIRLDVRSDTAKRIESFSILKKMFQAKGIMIFGIEGQKGFKQVYIGGLKKPQELRILQSEIKQYHIYNYALKKLHSKRSYKLIMSQLFKTPFMRKQLMSFNKVNMIDVDYVQKEGPLRYTFNTLSKVDCSFAEYEDKIMKLILQFFVVTFVIRSKKDYYEKLEVPEQPDIVFKMVKEWKKEGLYYLMIIADKQLFFAKSKEIANQLEKVGDLIAGIRFFNYMQPNFRNFDFDNEKYLIRKFPKAGTYSMNVSAKTREGHVFNWREVFKMILDQKNKYDKNPSENESIIE